MSRSSIATLRIGLVVLGLVCLSGVPGAAQTTSQGDPPTQDSELIRLLGLGAASGCFELLRVADDGSAVAGALDDLGTEIGNELRAICSPSAVTSASSLGGGLNTLQPVKTVTQFRLARGRIDQRLQRPAPPPRPRPGQFIAIGSVQVAPSPSVSPATRGPDGIGLFGELEFDARDRTDTPYESGYESDVRGIAVGLDYVHGRAVFGGWVGRTQQNADFTRFGPLLSGFTNASQRQVLGQPSVLASVCGGLSNAGSFEQSSTRAGGFAGWGIGGPGFVDATVAWGRREHDYARSVCAIEMQGELSFANGVLRDSVNDPVDDIFAGTLLGTSTIRETSFSVRTGADVGNHVVTFGPRAILTLSRASTDAFVETGRSTVANTVRPVGAPDITRTLGGPIGLELAFDEQSRTSVLLDAGAEVSFRAGPIVPHAAGYWRHEFRNDFHRVSARFAQDLRADPVVFDFGQDAYDANSLLFAFGVSALAGDRFAARFEVTQLTADYLFDSRVISAQARVRF